MGLPSSSEARPFYRCAFERLKDAHILLDQGRGTGAIYLAGYSVECIMKALILSTIPVRRSQRVLVSFKGRSAHDFEWLQKTYRKLSRALLPSEVKSDFILVSGWSTDIRYTAGETKLSSVEKFLHAANRICEWADGRM